MGKNRGINLTFRQNITFFLGRITHHKNKNPKKSPKNQNISNCLKIVCIMEKISQNISKLHI